MAVQGATLHLADISTDRRVQPWRQEIRFCRAPDGAQLAFAMAGSGDPLVAVGGFATHLEYDQEHPWIGPVLAGLKEVSTYLRYDERGEGLSQDGQHDFRLARRVRDLEAVVDAAGLDRFALFGASISGPVAIAYAARHPDRVSHLVLSATYARGPALGADGRREAEAIAGLIGVGWGRSARLRHILSTALLPGAGEETVAWLDDHQHLLTTGPSFAASYLSRVRVDVTALLRQIRAPTLVLHARDDLVIDFSEAIRLTAAIPGARLIPIETGGHVWPERGQWQRDVTAIDALIATPRLGARSESDLIAVLSVREVDVLDLASYGLSNSAMAERMCLSVRTVERHLSNIYLKLQVSGATARTAAVGMYLRRQS
ncbi:MAG: alpha/beta fold hydrolase [Actinomycetia bacterium]|nr:alpha/beta fold hydrolase [Actinomycetes bacterium]